MYNNVAYYEDTGLKFYGYKSVQKYRKHNRFVSLNFSFHQNDQKIA